jgi:hypothetical protein
MYNTHSQAIALTNVSIIISNYICIIKSMLFSIFVMPVNNLANKIQCRTNEF